MSKHPGRKPWEPAAELPPGATIEQRQQHAEAALDAWIWAQIGGGPDQNLAQRWTPAERMGPSEDPPDPIGHPRDPHVETTAIEVQRVRKLFREHKVRGHDAIACAMRRCGLPRKKRKRLVNQVRRSRSRASGPQSSRKI